MRLSQSESVAKSSRKGQKSRNKFKGKIKQKRLDAICEKSYNRSHKGVPKVDSSELNDVGKELEPRRSNRARRAPVLLDSSPLPPKKRLKIDSNGPRSIEQGGKIFRVKYESPCSSSRDLDGKNGAWGSRLRFRGKGTSFSGRERGESSSRGKRKLFEDFDRFKDDMEAQNHHNKEELAVEKSTVVKSKRPGRIKASNVLENENQDIDLGGGVECDKEKNRDEVFEMMDEGDELRLENIVEIRSEIRVKDVNMALDLDEREDASGRKESELEEGHSNGNVETGEEKIEVEKLACDLVPERSDAVEVDCVTSGQAKDDGCHGKPPEVETHEKLKGKYNVLSAADRKPRIKLGRRCGLCGGGIDGRPPKILLLDGTGSDNEAYSGSSASEEPNYDIWDGFGDESGWLGRLLGPINDRLGIAGIWVHQQCAVWSPEVYFAGLGCLKNIRTALYRGRMLKCNRCRRPGATIGCRVDRCPKTYHLPCARARGCIFDHRKFLIACTDHRHLFQPHGMQNVQRLKKMKAKKMKLEMRKIANDAYRKDIEVEEKWLENCGEDEEFLKRESKRLHRDLWRIAPVYIGGTNSESETKFLGWESVAGLQHVIRCMKEVVILPLLYPEFFKNLGLTPPRGVLLHGYPGTGKTLVVRALVGSCARGDKRIAYFARKGADCLGKYVGDAERQLRLLFQVAEKSQPSIIFFDEIDGLAPCRTKQQDQTHSSVVSTLLALMDGLKSRGSVIVIGATNRPEAVDPALRRPGRFDREIYFPLPSVKDREAILSLHTQKWPKPINGSLLKWIAKRTVGFAGADLQALCTQAAIIALRRSFPLQEVLLAAETKDSHSNFPPIPSFSVEERDWLQAFSCAPPPCSQREGGVVVNNVVSSPLDTHLIPCLLQPLTRLLALLYLDERIWLPPPLNNASTLIKNVIVSALDWRRVQSDRWWLHVDDLLQEVDVKDEIVKNLSLANILVGGTMPCSSIVIEDNIDETCSKFFSPDFKGMGAHSGFLRNMSYATCHKSGFQVLISGNPRCGQRHLASCLLHCFVGNVDVWKVDLASISQEGHGDMVNGLTRILIRCAGANLCMIYMPRIDLWALETCNEAREGHCESSLMEPQSSEKISFEGQCEIAMEHELSPSSETEVTESEAAVKESYLWTLFSEQVESMGANTSLIILGTSELPFPLLPPRIRQFFRSDVNKSTSISLVHKVSRFSVELDGKFDNDMVIDSFAAKLSKDLMQQFVVSFHGRNHVHDNSFKEKTFDTVEGGVCHGKSNSIHPLNPVPFMNKSMKGKQSLLLAISSVGYQILCYPHFAELCWVTSKLKEGPCTNINGPWKCWPFNSCILRPINSPEKAATVSGLDNIKSKESGLVRGLVSVGLSAYRGEYSSLRVVCSEVRKVLEILVGRIDDKIQAGKDRSQFIRLLSQVAYLEDMVISWAQALQSLEVDARISDATANICVGSSDNDVCKDSISEGNGLTPEVFDRTIHVPNLPDESPHEIGVNEAVRCNLINGDDGCINAGDEAIVNGNVPSQLVVKDQSSPNKHNSLPNEVLEFNKTGSAGDQAGFGAGIVVSFKLCNGPKQSHDFQADGPFGSGDELCDKLQSDDFQADGPCGSGDEHCDKLHFQADGPCGSGDEHCDKLHFQVDGPCGSGDEHCDKLSSAKVFYGANGLSSTNNNILFKDNCENVGSSGLEVNYALKSTSFNSGSFATCFYQCCSECFVNLQKLLLKIIKIEWGLDGSILTVEDVHDLVSSLSANLHLTLSKLSRAESLYGRTLDSKCKKCLCHKCGEIDKSECTDIEKRLMIECDCHAKCKNITEKEGCSQVSGKLDSSFIFRDGVLITLDEGTDVSYHCKFEKLCLCFLIEWVAMSKEPFD